MKSVSVFACVILFISCGRNGKQTLNGRNNTISSDALADTISLVQKWRSDSLGCDKIRSKELGEKIIQDHHLDEYPLSVFVGVMGGPNKTQIRDSRTILSYYFDSFCEGGAVIDSMDYCIAGFYFENDHLVGRDYVCI